MPVEPETVEMPGAHPRNTLPTVSYLSVFPDNGHKMHLPNLDSPDVVGPCKPLDEDLLHAGKYLELNKYHFKDATGKQKNVEGESLLFTSRN